jgi:holo-[acyl-carrier protein] synthase
VIKETMFQLRTGVDLIEIDRLSRVGQPIRDRFLKRVFTARELLEAGGADASLLGRFAAKEAVSKALGTGIGLVAWQEIEIIEGAAGEPLVSLHGRAHEAAEAAFLHHWSVSISHSQTHAVAFVVAYGGEPA